MDWKTAISTGTAVVMAIAAGVQQFRVDDLDSDLGNVAQARDKALTMLKETRDGVEANSKRVDSTIVDLQDQVSKALANTARLEKENAALNAQVDAAQVSIQRMTDLASTICKRN